MTGQQVKECVFHFSYIPHVFQNDRSVRAIFLVRDSYTYYAFVHGFTIMMGSDDRHMKKLETEGGTRKLSTS